MNTLNQHRFLSTTLFLGTLLALLARPLTVLVYDWVSSVGSSQIIFPHIPHRALRTSKKMPLAKTSPKVIVTPQTHGLSLRSFERDYTYFISGQAMCADKPCAASLTISILRDGVTDPTTFTVETNTDGTFWTHVPFQALPNHQLDWKVTALSSDLQSGEIHGRQIMSDDPRLDVTSDIILH